jgi:hypothetical protein
MGRFQVSTTTIDGRATIRFASLNPRTTRPIVDEALAIVRDTASQATLRRGARCRRVDHSGL